MQVVWVKALKGKHASMALCSGLPREVQGQEAEASYLMAVMYDDENISSTASSKWAVVTRPGELGFWQENSQISVARLQMSRQRRASPERAATYKREHFIPWDPLAVSTQEKNRFCVQLKRKGRAGNGLKHEIKYLALAGNLVGAQI